MATKIVSLQIEVDDSDVKGAEKSLGGLKSAARNTGTAKKELGELEDSLNGVGAGSAAAAGGLGRLAAAAGPVGAAVGVAAVAIAAVAAAAVKAGQEIFELSKKYAELGEELARTSRETGVSAESISALRHQATLAGTEFSQVTSAIDAFSQKVVDASAGSKEARKTLESLGVSGVTAATDVDQAFSMAVTTLAEMPAGLERAKVANEAFGSSGSKLLPLLDEFDGDLQALIDSADKFGTLIGEDNVRDSLAFQRAMRENKQHVEGLKNEFIKGFLPVITEVFETFNALLRENSAELKSWVRTGAIAAQATVAGIENQIDTHSTLLDIRNLSPTIAAAQLRQLASRISKRIETASFLPGSASGGFEGLPERGQSAGSGGRTGRAGREPRPSPLERVWTAQDLAEFARERGFEVTSTTGGRHNVGSLHPQGRAIDIRTRDKTEQQIGELIAQALAAGIRIVDERLRPPGQRVWGGPHLHLEENDTRASFFNRALEFGGRSVEDLLALDEARRMGATQFIDDPRGRAEALREQRIQRARDIFGRGQGSPAEISSQSGSTLSPFTPRTTLNQVEIERMARLAPGLFDRIFAEEERGALGAGLSGEKAELTAIEATFKRIKDLEAEFVESRTKSVELGVRRLHLSFSESHHQEIVNSMLEEARIFQEEELDTLNKQLEVQEALAGDALFRQYEAEAQVLREKLRLQQEIFGLETLLATQGTNQAERYRKAWLEAIYEIRDENIRAVEDQIRAQVRLGDMQTVHNEQIRAKVLGHLAAQKSITETIGDEIIGLYEEIATRSEEILDRSIGKIPILGGLAKTLVRQSLTRATTRLLDTFFPGAASRIEALQNPELGELKTQTSILKSIEINTAIGAGSGGAGNVTINASLGQLASQFLGGGGGASGTRPRIVGAGGNLAGLDIGQIINLLSGLQRSSGTSSPSVTLTPSSATRPRIVNTGTFGPNGRFSAGNIGALVSLAGGLIPGNVGGVISSIGSGIGIASSLGSILGISALGGPIGLAIGAGIGLLTAVFGGLFGSKKRKRDKEEKLPQLMQGFNDAIQEFRDLITQVRTFAIDPDQALSRGKELRQQIASGFGIRFESKKYRTIARERINQQLSQIDAKPDGLMQQLMDAVSIAKAAGDRRQRILPEFAGGVFMDALFRAQFGAFKRRNGLLPGSWSGVDKVPALLADAEMVLNPAQQRNVIANAGGRDVFAGAGIPNYESKVRSAPAVHTMNTGGLVRSGQSETSPLVLQPNFSFEIQGVTFEEGARIWLQSDDGRRTLVKVIREEI